MKDINNNVNLNNVHNTYAPKSKKPESANISAQDDNREVITNDGTKAAESYGRILVNKSNNTEMIQGVKDAMEFFMQNPELAAAAVRSSDDAYELLEAQETDNAYEKACCGACDAAYDRA